jgi:CHAT domain-containing protein
VDENDRFLVSEYRFTYLTSGRDLLRQQDRLEPRSPAILLGDPEFGLPASTGPNLVRSGEMKRSAEIGNFDALPGTEAELETVKKLLPAAAVFTRNSASEANVKTARGPQFLHIATHGFFLHDSAVSALAKDSSGLSFLQGESVTTAALGRLPENPLVRSGLALAGANQRRSGNDDGLLTALEAASLDLWGTRIVMLSACETGVGQLENGEGVQGLRRALVLSGAETQVLSLWKIDDRATAELVREYYKRVLMGVGRSEAMRQVQLEMLEHPATARPYYWAPFIVLGDGRSLDGREPPPVPLQRHHLTASELLSRKPTDTACPRLATTCDRP